MVEVTDEIVIGNLEDIHHKETIVSRGGTINFERQSHRDFLPGNYLLSSPHEGVVIVHHENVDPAKIHFRLLHSDSGNSFRLSNYINRYDLNYEETSGIQKRLPGLKRFVKMLLGQDLPDEKDESDSFDDESDSSDDEYLYDRENKRLWMERICFFLPVKYRHLLSQPNNLKVVAHEKVERCWTIYNKDDEKQLGFCIDVNHKLLGDWPYGCMMQDNQTEKLFALVLTDLYTCNTLSGEVDEASPNFASVEKNNYNFPLRDFIV